MIAKVLGAGGGWSGKIEYLYEGKLATRQASDKRAEVILHSDNVRVPRDLFDKAGRQAMKADFIFQSQSHRLANRNDKTIGEHVLSFTTEDMRALRNKNGMHQVASEYVKLLGLDKTQHVAILHQDTDNPHLHIVFNRVINEGKKYKDSHEKRRALAAAVVLSQKYGLHLVGNLKPAAEDRRTKTMRAGMEDLRKLQQTLPIFFDALNMRHLHKLAEKEGMVALNEKGDRIMIEGQEYKRSDLEAMFQANRNAAALAKNAKTEELAAGIDAARVNDLERQAAHGGVDFRQQGTHVSLDGEKYSISVVEEIPRLNASSLSGTDPALPSSPRLAAAVNEPERDGYAQYLAEVRRDLPILQTAVSFEEIEKQAALSGITYQQEGDSYTTIGERTFSDRVIEQIIAENVQWLKEERGAEVSLKIPQPQEENLAKNAQQTVTLQSRLTALEPAELTTLEAATAQEQQTPPLTFSRVNRQLESKHANTPALLGVSKDSPEYQQVQRLGQGYVGRMVSQEQDMARENRSQNKGKNKDRQGSKRMPDYQQKIGKLKLSTNKSKKMRL